MVQKPKYAEMHDWDGFLLYCKREGINAEEWEDLEDWWDCWKAGFNSAMNF